MANKSEVAEVKGSSALVLGSSFEDDAQSGFDNMNQEDFALPFLRLLTNSKPSIDRDEVNTIEKIT